MGAKEASRATLVSIDGLPDYYATFSGGEVTAEVAKAWDGGRKTADLVPGAPDTSNLVCGRPYGAARDQEIVRRLEKLVGSWRTTVTTQDTDSDFTPIGEPTTYADALLVRVKRPESDAASGDSKTYELEFATSGAA